MMGEATRQLARIQFEALNRNCPIPLVRWMAGLTLLAFDGAMCRDELRDP
jgi:hypothetical protein